MQGVKQMVAYHFPGTLAANQVVNVAIPFNCTLEQVIATATNATNATLEVGSVADPNGWITSFAIGVSNALVVKDAGDFNGALMTAAMGDKPRLAAGDIVQLTLDFDGAAGTAAINADIMLVLSEG